MHLEFVNIFCWICEEADPTVQIKAPLPPQIVQQVN